MNLELKRDNEARVLEWRVIAWLGFYEQAYRIALGLIRFESLPPEFRGLGEVRPQVLNPTHQHVFLL